MFGSRRTALGAASLVRHAVKVSSDANPGAGESGFLKRQRGRSKPVQVQVTKEDPIDADLESTSASSFAMAPSPRRRVISWTPSHQRNGKKRAEDTPCQNPESKKRATCARGVAHLSTNGSSTRTEPCTSKRIEQKGERVVHRVETDVLRQSKAKKQASRSVEASQEALVGVSPSNMHLRNTASSTRSTPSLLQCVEEKVEHVVHRVENAQLQTQVDHGKEALQDVQVCADSLDGYLSTAASSTAKLPSPLQHVEQNANHLAQKDEEGGQGEQLAADLSTVSISTDAPATMDESGSLLQSVDNQSDHAVDDTKENGSGHAASEFCNEAEHASSGKAESPLCRRRHPLSKHEQADGGRQPGKRLKITGSFRQLLSIHTAGAISSSGSLATPQDQRIQTAGDSSSSGQGVDVQSQETTSTSAKDASAGKIDGDACPGPGKGRQSQPVIELDQSAALVVDSEESCSDSDHNRAVCRAIDGAESSAGSRARQAADARKAANVERTPGINLVWNNRTHAWVVQTRKGKGRAKTFNIRKYQEQGISLNEADKRALQDAVEYLKGLVSENDSIYEVAVGEPATRNNENDGEFAVSDLATSEREPSIAHCYRCKRHGNPNLLLLCDGLNGNCPRVCHTYCDGLGCEVPEDLWFCSQCRGEHAGVQRKCQMLKIPRRKRDCASMGSD